MVVVVVRVVGGGGCGVITCVYIMHVSDVACCGIGICGVVDSIIVAWCRS